MKSLNKCYIKNFSVNLINTQAEQLQQFKQEPLLSGVFKRNFLVNLFRKTLYEMYEKGFGPIMHALLLHTVDHVNSYGATLNSLNHIIKI